MPHSRRVCASSALRWPREWRRSRRKWRSRRGDHHRDTEGTEKKLCVLCVSVVSDFRTRSEMSHTHHTGETSRKLLIASIATAAFVVVEIVVGVRANSLALVGDALHNVTDTLALLLALFAVRVERR